METKKYSLNDLIKIIWKNIIVIIVFAVIGGSGFFILAKHKQSTTYTAERSMMISHSLDSKRAHSQVSADLAMIPTYEDLIKSRQVTESTWKALPKSIRKETSPKSISDNIDTNNRPESLVITVKATTKDANQSLAIANTTVEVAKKELPKIGELVTYDDKTGRVFELNILNKSYKFKTDDGEEIEVLVNKDEGNK